MFITTKPALKEMLKKILLKEEIEREEITDIKYTNYYRKVPINIIKCKCSNKIHRVSEQIRKLYIVYRPNSEQGTHTKWRDRKISIRLIPKQQGLTTTRLHTAHKRVQQECPPQTIGKTEPLSSIGYTKHTTPLYNTGKQPKFEDKKITNDRNRGNQTTGYRVQNHSI